MRVCVLESTVSRSCFPRFSTENKGLAWQTLRGQVHNQQILCETRFRKDPFWGMRLPAVRWGTGFPWESKKIGSCQKMLQTGDIALILIEIQSQTMHGTGSNNVG